MEEVLTDEKTLRAKAIEIFEYTNISDLSENALIAIIIFSCHYKPDFDLLCFINKRSKNICKNKSTIKDFISRLREIAKMDTYTVQNCVIGLYEFREEIDRIDGILRAYGASSEDEINSVISNYCTNYHGKLTFDGDGFLNQNLSEPVQVKVNPIREKQLESELDQLRKEYTELKKRYDTNQRKIQEITDELSLAQSGKEQLSVERIQWLQSQINDLNQNQSGIKSQMTALNNELAGVTSRFSRVESEDRDKYVKMEEENTELKDTNTELKKRIAELEEEKKILQEKYDKVNEDFRKGLISEEQANIEVKKLIEEKERKENENATLKRQIAMQQRQFETRTHEMESTMREEYDMKMGKQQEQHRIELGEWQSRWQDVNTQKQNLVAQTQELYGRLADARKEQGYFEGKYDGAQARISDLQASNRASDQRFEDIQQHMFEQQKDYNQLQYNAGYLQGVNKGLKENQKFIIDTSNRLLDSKDEYVKFLSSQLEEARKLALVFQSKCLQLQSTNEKLLTDGNAIIQSKNKLLQEKEQVIITEYETRKRTRESDREEIRRDFYNTWNESMVEVNKKIQQLESKNQQLESEKEQLKKENVEKSDQLIIVRKQLEVKAPVKEVDIDETIRLSIMCDLIANGLIGVIKTSDLKENALEKQSSNEFERIRSGWRSQEVPVPGNTGNSLVMLQRSLNGNKETKLYYKYYDKNNDKYIYINLTPFITDSGSNLLGNRGTIPTIRYTANVLDIDVTEPNLLPAPEHKDESDN